MNRRMIALNVVLAALAIWAGIQWRSQYVAARARERRMYNAKVPPLAATPLPPLPAQPPVLATGYNEVAQKLLLHPSRNPDIAVDPPPPPPPPPPMPPLPKYHGQMNLDGDVVAILSAGKDDPPQEVKAGGVIGQFRLVDVNTRDITFQWRDQQVRKTLDQVLDTSQAQAAANSANVSSSAPAEAAPPPPAIKSQVGPVGEVSQFGRRACDPNDSYAEGSVVDGWRKVLSPTPFGKACYWDRAGR